MKILYKTIRKKVINDIFSKMMFNTLKNYINFVILYHFYQKEFDLKTSKSLQLIYMIKLKLKEPLNHRLILKKVHKVIKFNQTTWLKPYIDMNTKLRQKAKNNFEKDFFKLTNNPVFGKPIEKAYVRKHKNIKLVTTERRRNYLVSEPNYQITEFFTENLLAIEMRKIRILVNKTACLGLSILDLSRTEM